MGASKDFIGGYLEAAAWTAPESQLSTEEIQSMDFSKQAKEYAKRDSDIFVRVAEKLLEETGASDSQHGHDFWLTRNRHGTGFWDRGYGPVGKELTEISHRFGEVEVYPHRGRLHFER